MAGCRRSDGTEGIWSSRVGSSGGATSGSRTAGGGTGPRTVASDESDEAGAFAGSAVYGSFGDSRSGSVRSVRSVWWSRSGSVGCKAGTTMDGGAGSGSGPNAANGISSIKAGSDAASTGVGSSEETSGFGASADGMGSLLVPPECDGSEPGCPVIVGGSWGSGRSGRGGGSLDSSVRVGSGAISTCATTPPAPPPAACGRICRGVDAHGKGWARGLAGDAGAGSGTFGWGSSQRLAPAGGSCSSSWARSSTRHPFGCDLLSRPAPDS